MHLSLSYRVLMLLLSSPLLLSCLHPPGAPVCATSATVRTWRFIHLHYRSRRHYRSPSTPYSSCGVRSSRPCSASGAPLPRPRSRKRSRRQRKGRRANGRKSSANGANAATPACVCRHGAEAIRLYFLCFSKCTMIYLAGPCYGLSLAREFWGDKCFEFVTKLQTSTVSYCL